MTDLLLRRHDMEALVGTVEHREKREEGRSAALDRKVVCEKSLFESDLLRQQSQ